MSTIQIKRGLSANIASLVLAIGEIAFTTDTKKVYVGVDGTSTKVMVNVDTSTFATLASPAFTGSPTAPTPSAGTNTTQVATTAFVTSAIATAHATIDGGTF